MYTEVAFISRMYEDDPWCINQRTAAVDILHPGDWWRVRGISVRHGDGIWL
jgi:hypothetical protein